MASVIPIMLLALNLPQIYHCTWTAYISLCEASVPLHIFFPWLRFRLFSNGVLSISSWVRFLQSFFNILWGASCGTSSAFFIATVGPEPHSFGLSGASFGNIREIPFLMLSQKVAFLFTITSVLCELAACLSVVCLTVLYVFCTLRKLHCTSWKWSGWFVCSCLLRVTAGGQILCDHRWSTNRPGVLLYHFFLLSRLWFRLMPFTDQAPPFPITVHSTRVICASWLFRLQGDHWSFVQM